MEGENQERIFQAMERPDFYPHPVSDIEQRETHISKVFLTGEYVYKIKKPVNLEFLDFTTLEKRYHFCRQEVILNRRLTRDVYLDVVPITCKEGHYELAGSGTPVEYAVKMRQLPGNCSLVRLLRKGKIDITAIESLAMCLAGFYSKAPSGKHISTFGSWERVWENSEENFRQTAPFVEKPLDKRMFQILRAANRSFLQRQKGLFEHRIKCQKIRDCHGDLRAGHIYITPEIQIIDCIEFNERFRYGDSASDLAFLAMDLDHEGYPEIARDLLSAYVRHSKDRDLFLLLNFYKCYRAVVRVKVNCFRLQEDHLSRKEKCRLFKETEDYMNLAFRYAVQFACPVLWVICGLPASGKTAIAEALAETTGARIFRSDVVRKGLFGLKPSEPRDAPFQKGIYSKEAGSLTYGKLLLLAQEEIQRGHSVILDATYGKRNHRQEVIRMAKDMDANLIFVECVCPEDLIRERLRVREKLPSESDARLHHLERIRAAFEPLDEIRDEMHILVHTDRPIEESLQQILSQDYDRLARQTEKTIHQKDR
ncbi:MAG: AAA family ATPase [bacterium]